MCTLAALNIELGLLRLSRPNYKVDSLLGVASWGTPAIYHFERSLIVMDSSNHRFFMFTNYTRSPLGQRLWIAMTLVLAALPSLKSPDLAGQEQWLDAMSKINPNLGTTFKIDEALVKAAGVRKVTGKHLDLYTDARDDEKVDELVVVFDRSVEQWCRFFEIDPGKATSWKLRAFLIADPKVPDRFRNAQLLPDGLPRFQAGFQRGHNLWLYLQPGKYYTRHLLIHEGTHGFMLWFLNGYGAPWYGEGIAEQFGVHRWSNQNLKLLYRLRDRSEAEYWGRVKRIKDERDTDKGMTLSDVLNIPPTAFLEVRYYAWSWAGCEFFSKHEKTKAAFRNLRALAHLDSAKFNQQFQLAIQNGWDTLERDWELFVGEMEYGYQVDRGQISVANPIGERSGSANSKFEVRSDRSWQSTSIQVKKGDRIRISGSGEFRVGPNGPSSSDPSKTPWKSQSNGITIEYYQGYPLGMLHAGILNPTASTAREQIKGLLKPIPVGLNAEITAPATGTLCLRINESPANLDTNQGALEVDVEKLE